MSEHPAPDPGALRAAIAGDVVTPGESGWDDARRAWNLVADQRPAFVVLPETPDDVAATVRFAQANGLRVAPQTTGHGATTLGDLGGTILLRTARLDTVAIDPGARAAHVGAGALWRDVVAPAGAHGLAALHGFSGGVGVAGYTLGGGVGWLARRNGFASGSVRSLEVVTADGEQRHVDAASEPDLFWALRGGGGPPAIVTSLVLGLLPLREVFAGGLWWPIERAAEVVHAYREWIATLPDTVTSTVRLIRYPPLPEVPEPLRGRALVAVTLAFTGDEDEGAALVAPLRAIAPAHLDTLATVPATALGALAGDPPGPLPGIGNGRLLATFAPEVADAFVELAGPGVDSPLIQLEIRHLGGALRTPESDPGAAGSLDADALIYGVGVPVTPEVGAAIGATLAAVRERTAPWTPERGTLVTFDEHDGGVRGAFPAATADRLERIAAAYDPHGLLVAAHAIG